MNCTCLLHKGCCPIHGEYWEKEFEDELMPIVCEHGSVLLSFDNCFIEDLIEKYLKIKLNEVRKVKIKCKDSYIQIERIK